MTQPTIPIFVVSGGKGIAGHTMVHSLIIQYTDYSLPVSIIPNVQTEERITEVVTQVKNAGGILTHTMVNSTLRQFLMAECQRIGVKEVDFMGGLANYLENERGLKSVNVPGLYSRINAQYFERIEAIEYTLNHDDGINPQRLHEAEIILTGVSRSGKTPLSVYMSMFGWKVANIPIVNGINPPEELYKVDPRRVFGLNISINYLIAQRHSRLVQMKNLQNSNYIDSHHVQQEMRFAHFVFERGGFTVINVTNKPIETTANEIIGFISERFKPEEQKLGPEEERENSI